MGAIGNELMIYAVIYVSIPAMGGNSLKDVFPIFAPHINPRDGGGNRDLHRENPSGNPYQSPQWGAIAEEIDNAKWHTVSIPAMGGNRPRLCWSIPL